MQVRTFESKDMATGLQMIKKELGPDALILSTKTIRDKSAGILGKRLFEITAAIDGDPPKLHSVSARTQATLKTEQTDTLDRLAFRHVIDEPLEEFLSVENPAEHPAESSYTQISDQTVPPTSQTSLKNEVAELKQLVQSLARQLGQITKETELLPGMSQSRLQISDQSISQQRLSGSIQGDQILSSLVARGINVETARSITGFIRESLTDQELSNADTVRSTIIDILQNLIEVSLPSEQTPAKQRRIAFVGPTGVGKTTTLAKIAAAQLNNHSASVALVTIDTYRIAAVEQLRVYGDIMHLPLEIVITPDQLEKALAKHSDKDLILIDTAGRSPNDTISIDELGTFFKPELEIEKHLVLSAVAREDELINTIAQFNSLALTNTIFTKIDECKNLGILLNVQLQNPTPLSYMTNGQKVPEDLLHLSPKLVAKLIMSYEEGSFND